MPPLWARQPVDHEFYAPFAHLPGRYEWCRLRTATHGVFDSFILLGASTAEPATVYVNSQLGQRFMQERFPECATHRVAAAGLRIEESAGGRSVTGTLEAEAGPVRKAEMRLEAPASAMPRAEPYGGEGRPVWGSRFTCWGVDLVLEGTCDGRIEREDGSRQEFVGVACVVTLGSYGRLEPLRAAGEPAPGAARDA